MSALILIFWMLSSGTILSQEAAHTPHPEELVLQKERTGVADADSSASGGSPFFRPRSKVRRVSLLGWADYQRLMMLDRTGTVTGMGGDRGIFQHYTHRMNHEYDLSQMSIPFNSAYHHDWYRRDPLEHTLFRSYFGSITTSRLMTETHLRTAAEFVEGHIFDVDMRKQHDFRADRLWLELGYRIRLSDRREIGISQTIDHYKPDLDLTLHYKYGSMDGGGIRVEGGPLDYLNNILFDVLGVQDDGREEPWYRSYKRQPWHLGIRAVTPSWQGVRAEATGGFQTPSRALYTSFDDPELGYTEHLEGGYAGGLLEYAHPWFTTGSLIRYSYSSLERTPDENRSITADYTNESEQRRLGLYVLTGVNNWNLEIWRFYDRYEEEQQGDRFETASIPNTFRHIYPARRWRAELFRKPSERGWILGFGYYEDNTGELAYPRFLRQYRNTNIPPKNHRLTLSFGWKFRPDIWFYAGVGYDLDGDVHTGPPSIKEEPSRFDSGYLKGEITF